jgi:hypothetical protein
VKRKNDQPKDAYSEQVFAIGEDVIIKRPHLHSGNVGIVLFYKSPFYRIRIPIKCEHAVEPFWHVDAKAEDLEIYI